MRRRRKTRRSYCVSLTKALRDGGHALWIDGALIGPDRANGESPFGFGSDAVVGLASTLQIAGELMAGASLLFDDGNRFGAAALIRQLVEVEYLAWAFVRGLRGGRAVDALQRQ